MLQRRKFTWILGILLLLNSSAYGYWTTGHSLIGEISTKYTLKAAMVEINRLLNIVPEVKGLSDKTGLPALVTLAEVYDYPAAASTWADDIKAYTWSSKDIRARHSQLHFLDIAIDGKSLDNPGLCAQETSKTTITKAMKAVPINVLSGLQSSIKTLVLKSTTDGQKAMALRYLLHLVGDLHQPLHLASLTFDGKRTFGNNLVKLTPNKDPEETPHYYQVIGNDPWHDLQELDFPNMHAYFDGMIGLFPQLQETIDSQYAPQGYELWQQNKDEYLRYLAAVGKEIGDDKNRDDVTPGLINWAAESSNFGCNILTNSEVFTYTKKGKDYYSQQAHSNVLSHASPKMQDLLRKGGIRLGYLLDAIFVPTSKDPIVMNYRNLIVKPIASDPYIVDLASLLRGVIDSKTPQQNIKSSSKPVMEDPRHGDHHNLIKVHVQ